MIMQLFRSIKLMNIAKSDDFHLINTPSLVLQQIIRFNLYESLTISDINRFIYFLCSRFPANKFD